MDRIDRSGSDVVVTKETGNHEEMIGNGSYEASTPTSSSRPLVVD